jgi:hypothetical protein
VISTLVFLMDGNLRYLCSDIFGALKSLAKWNFGRKSEGYQMLRSVVLHRLEEISQDPEWIQRIDREGPTPLYKHLFEITKASDITTADQDVHIVYQSVKQSRLISKKFLK